MKHVYLGERVKVVFPFVIGFMLLFFAADDLASAAPVSHPALLFHNISETQGFQQRTISPWSGWESSIMASAANAMLKNFSDPAYFDIVSPGGRPGSSFNLALAYQITKDAKYAEKAKSALLNVNLGVDPQNRSLVKAEQLIYYSLAYDWVQPYLDLYNDTVIRDKLAILTNDSYDKLNMISGNRDLNYIDYVDYHGRAYPSVAIAGMALSDYTNPNNLQLTSGPSDWIKAGTDYLFVNDLLHSYNRSVFSMEFDNSGFELSGSYKIYHITDLAWLSQVYSHFYGRNIFDDYPIAKKAISQEIWASLPNYYSPDYVTLGNLNWIHQDGFVNLFDDGNKSYVLNYLDAVKSSNILPYSESRGILPVALMYIVYNNYTSIQRSAPSWTSHLDKDSVLQVFRKNWNGDSDWMSLTTWNYTSNSNRYMAHHDQLGFEYYSRGDILLADGGEHKHILGQVDYSSQEVYHNTIAIEDPRSPFIASWWANSSARGIFKGYTMKLDTPLDSENLVQAPWMEMADASVTIKEVLGDISFAYSRTLSSPINYERIIVYPNKDYFIVVDRLEGSEAWTYRNIFRPTSLNITPTTGTGATEAEVGHVNGNLVIGSIPYDWLSLPYKNEIATGITTSTIKWNTTNPYGNKVEMNLFSVPASEIKVIKHVGRIAGYTVKSEVFNPVVYFRSAPTNNLYRVTVPLSRYPSEEEKVPSQVAVTGTGSAIKVSTSAYEDYIYSGRGTSSFASFSTDSDTLYVRKAASLLEYTIINGSYVNDGGSPLVIVSNKVFYMTLKKDTALDNITFKIKGTGTVSITLKGMTSSSYAVTRDGIPYSNFVKSGTDLVITTNLSEHEFEVTTSFPRAPKNAYIGLLTYFYADGNVSYSGPTDGKNATGISALPASGNVSVLANRFSSSFANFSADAAGGNAVFTVGSLKPNANYSIKRDGIPVNTTQADSSGKIVFSSSA